MSEQYVTLAEVRDLLTEELDKRGDLSTIQKAAMTHAQTIAKITKEQADEIIKRVSELEFVNEVTSYKIADILPKYPEDVRAIFSKERINLESDDIQKILDAVLAMEIGDVSDVYVTDWDPVLRMTSADGQCWTVAFNGHWLSKKGVNYNLIHDDGFWKLTAKLKRASGTME